MTATRDKYLARLANLLRLTKSPNKYEAKLAQERADELARKHGLSPNEVTRAAAEPAPKHRPTYAGSAASTWQETLALAVARATKTRPLRANNKIFFDGPTAADAAARYRRIADEIAHTCADDLNTHTHWLGRVFSAIGADEPPSDDGQVGRIARWIWRADTESMTLRDGLVIVASRQPGNYVTMMSSHGTRFTHRGDLSQFNDAKRRYSWVFEQRGALVRGDTLVFATADREIVGDLVGAWIKIINRSARVARDGNGSPMWIE